MQAVINWGGLAPGRQQISIFQRLELMDRGGCNYQHARKQYEPFGLELVMQSPQNCNGGLVTQDQDQIIARHVYGN